MALETRLELATSSLAGMCLESYADPPGSDLGHFSWVMTTPPMQSS